jgi:hypothetical protein
MAAIDHDSAGQPQSTNPVELSRQIEELKGVLDTLTRERDWALSRAITHAATIALLRTEPRTRIWVGAAIGISPGCRYSAVQRFLEHTETRLSGELTRYSPRRPRSQLLHPYGPCPECNGKKGVVARKPGGRSPDVLGAA